MKHSLLLGLCLCLGQALSAAIPFWSSDFGNGLPNAWSSTDDSANGVLWTYCNGDFGACVGEDALISSFHSSTAANGFLVLNSAAAGALPGQGHISKLTSAAVDCSERGQVFVQFQTAIAARNTPLAERALLRVITATDTLVLRPFPMLGLSNLVIGKSMRAPVPALAPGRPYTVTFDISSVAAGQASVQLQWEWRANNQGVWLIDDVVMSEEHPAQPERAVYYEPFSFGSQGWASNVLMASQRDSIWRWAAGGDVSRGRGANISPFGPYFFLHSPTAADGGMVFHPDRYPIISAQTPPFYLCELISPVIDLSEVQQPLALSFHQLAWLGNTAFAAPQSNEGARFITSFAYSTDGGESWSEPEAVNPFLTAVTSANRDWLAPYDGREYYPLPNVEGVPAFRLKFTWAGDLYCWALDDIALVERPAHDLRTNRDYFARSPNAIVPLSQLADIPLQADAQNIGGQPVTEVEQTFELRRLPAAEPLLSFSEPIAAVLDVDELYEEQLFTSLLPAEAFLSTGLYEGTYGLSAAEMDDRAADNTLSWGFEVSDSTFAKEWGGTRDLAPTQSVRYTYGNCFYVPKGEGLYARYFSFAVGNSAALAQNAQSVNILLHEWAGDLNGDGFANPSELEEVAINLYAFTGDEGTGLITLPVSFEEVGVPLKDDTYYLASVRYEEGASPRLFFMVSDTVDYTATLAAYGQTALPRQYVSVLDIGNTGDFSTLGFGYDIVPVVRLHIGESPVLVSSSEPPLPSPRHALKVWPNPVKAGAELQLEVPEAAAEAELFLRDVSGRTVFYRKFVDLRAGKLTFVVASLPVGWYSVQLDMPDRTLTTPLLVQW